MNDFVVSVLNIGSYISVILMIVIGCLVVLVGLLYAIMFLLNKMLLEQTKATVYFMSYVRHRKKFIKWYKETNPEVYTPKISKDKF